MEMALELKTEAKPSSWSSISVFASLRILFSCFLSTRSPQFKRGIVCIASSLLWGIRDMICVKFVATVIISYGCTKGQVCVVVFDLLGKPTSKVAMFLQLWCLSPETSPCHRRAATPGREPRQSPSKWKGKARSSRYPVSEETASPEEEFPQSML